MKDIYPAAPLILLCLFFDFSQSVRVSIVKITANAVRIMIPITPKETKSWRYMLPRFVAPSRPISLSEACNKLDHIFRKSVLENRNDHRNRRCQIYKILVVNNKENYDFYQKTDKCSL